MPEPAPAQPFLAVHGQIAGHVTGHGRRGFQSRGQVEPPHGVAGLYQQLHHAPPDNYLRGQLVRRKLAQDGATGPATSQEPKAKTE